MFGEACGSSGKCEGCRVEEIGAKGRGTEGLTQKTATFFQFRRWTIEKGESMARAVGLRRCEGSVKGVDIGNGKDFRRCLLRKTLRGGARCWNVSMKMGRSS